METPPTTTRQLKVTSKRTTGSHFTSRKAKTYSSLVLSGNWLANLGFVTGTTATVEQTKEGYLLIKPPTQTPPTP